MIHVVTTCLGMRLLWMFEVDSEVGRLAVAFGAHIFCAAAVLGLLPVVLEADGLQAVAARCKLIGGEMHGVSVCGQGGRIGGIGDGALGHLMACLVVDI